MALIYIYLKPSIVIRLLLFNSNSFMTVAILINLVRFLCSISEKKMK